MPEQNQMKKCLYCGEEILPEAIKCKHCKSLLTGNSQISKPSQINTQHQFTVKPKEGLFLQTMNLGCGVILAFIIFIIVMAIIMSAIG